MFWKKRIYLDTAAGTAGNASSPHEEGRLAKKKLEDARTAIGRLVEAKPDDIIFTSGATEANALAIIGHVRAVRRAQRNNVHVLYLPSSHASIVENMQLLREEGVVVEALPVREGRVDTDALAKMLTPNTVLISMDAVCGETGVVWNTREVAEVLKKFRDGQAVFSLARGTAVIREKAVLPAVKSLSPLLHVDASQAPLIEKITRAHFDADMVTFDISKISAHRGIGCLIAHRTIPIETLYRGGGQERGLRPGSETPELADVFAEALSTAVENREAFGSIAEAARAQLLVELNQHVPEAIVNEGRSQAPQILNISLPGVDTDYLAALLDDEGFAVSTKSACETDSERRLPDGSKGSRAVLVITGDPERAKATLRISWGPETKMRELTQFALALAKVLKV